MGAEKPHQRPSLQLYQHPLQEFEFHHKGGFLVFKTTQKRKAKTLSVALITLLATLTLPATTARANPDIGPSMVASCEQSDSAGNNGWEVGKLPASSSFDVVRERHWNQGLPVCSWAQKSDAQIFAEESKVLPSQTISNCTGIAQGAVPATLTATKTTTTTRSESFGSGGEFGASATAKVTTPNMAGMAPNIELSATLSGSYSWSKTTESSETETYTEALNVDAGHTKHLEAKPIWWKFPGTITAKYSKLAPPLYANWNMYLPALTDGKQAVTVAVVSDGCRASNSLVAGTDSVARVTVANTITPLNGVLYATVSATESGANAFSASCSINSLFYEQPRTGSTAASSLVPMETGTPMGALSRSCDTPYAGSFERSPLTPGNLFYLTSCPRSTLNGVTYLWACITTPSVYMWWDAGKYNVIYNPIT
ncbi:hypothetical protein [Streptomyces sp. NPDC086835]|uniref:hypothetical protein n=1 Tax=Streptomyces sp. NPDC086835 TaxID=3365761 RepID=UPI0038204E5A